MSSRISKFIVPNWWSELYIGPLENGLSTESRSLSTLPPLYSHEQNDLLYCLAILQDKVKECHSNDRSFHIHLEEIENYFPTLSSPEIFAIQRILYLLPALRVQSVAQHKASPLFHVLDVQKNRVEIDFASTDVGAWYGIEDLYFSRLRNIESQVQVSDFSLRPSLPIEFRVWSQLDGFEKRIFLRLLTASRQSSREHHKIHVSLKGLSSQQEEMALMKQIERFLTKLEGLGLGEHSVDRLVNISGSEDRPFVEIDRLFVPEIDFGLSRSVAISLLKKFSKDDAKRLLLLTDHEVRFASILDKAEAFLSRVLLEPHDLGGGIFLQDSAQILQVPLLFLEWSFRNSPLHPYRLPDELMNSLFGDLCYLNDERLFENYKRFQTIMLRDEYVLQYIQKNNSSSILFQDKRIPNLLPQFELHSHKLTPVPQKEMISESSPPSNGAAEVAIEESVLQSSVADVAPEAVFEPSSENKSESQNSFKTNRLNAYRFAEAELKKIKQLDQKQYEKLKSRYIQSLSENEQHVLKELESKMRKDLFDSQMQTHLVKYMVSNPIEWSSIPRQPH